MTTEAPDRPATQRLGALRQAAQAARQAAADLRRRVRAGDGLVTARELAEADAAIEISDLRLEAAQEAAEAEQEAERRAANDQAAEAYLRAEAEIKAEFTNAVGAVRQAMADLAVVANRHNQVVAATTMAAEGAPEGYRLKSNRFSGVTLDHKPIHAIDAVAWGRRIYAEMTNQVAGTDPGLWPVEAQKVPERRR